MGNFMPFVTLFTVSFKNRPWRTRLETISMVAVAQLVESRIVIPVVVGSSPISHPIIVLFGLPAANSWSA